MQEILWLPVQRRLHDRGLNEFREEKNLHVHQVEKRNELLNSIFLLLLFRLNSGKLKRGSYFCNLKVSAHDLFQILIGCAWFQRALFLGSKLKIWLNPSITFELNLPLNII